MTRTAMLVALCLLSSLACAQPVQPRQHMAWQQLDVRAPASEGWVLASASPQALAFMRRSAALARSEVATVSVFQLPESLDRDGFMAWVRSAVQADSPPARFRPIEVQHEPMDERGYACVLHRSLTQDLQARGLAAGSEPPQLQLHALYCRHPARAGTGFAAAFSTRGHGLDDSLFDRARSFIDGITVPGR
jgi:hypothetical protein